MRNRYLFLSAFCSIIAFSSAQSQAIKLKNDTATLKLERLFGVGPAGMSSIGPSDKNAYPIDDPQRKSFHLKNIPSVLSDVREFNMPLDLYQFTFQNYVAGIFPKKYFLDRANAQSYQWPLVDTTKLSRMPIQVAISFVAGVDTAKNPIFILDANNDGDLSNDKINPLAWLRTEDQIKGAAIGADINYISNGKILKRKILLSLSKSPNPNRFDVSVFFPEFLFQKISFRGHNYFLCTSGYSLQPFIALLDEKPNFTEIDKSKRIYPGKYFRIGEADFKLLSIKENSNEVVIIGKDVAELTTNSGIHPAITKNSEAKEKIFSTSLGYYAPLVKGMNVNTRLSKGLQISTANLKGKYIYLDFWGTYCIPCIEEIPNIKEAYKKFGRDKFEVIGLLDESNMVAAKNLLSKHKIPWPNISLNSKTTNYKGYGAISSFPTSYLIDPNGKIAAVNLRGPELISKLNELMNR